MKSYYRWLKNNSLILCLLLFLLIFYTYKFSRSSIKVLQCKKQTEKAEPYSIAYRAAIKLNYQKEIETLVNSIEEALDYNAPDSEVSVFNRHYDSEPYYYQTPYFYPSLIKSKEIYNKTQNAFDPTIAPYLNLWRAHKIINSEPSELDILAIKPSVSLDYIVVNKTRVKKLKENVTININNLIPGLQVDNIANFLQLKGISNFCIQLEDLVLARGIPSKKKKWEIVQKISHPDLEKSLRIKIDLHDRAMAIIDNSNTATNNIEQTPICIDPLTGSIVLDKFIVAFVFAKDSATACGYATAFKAKNFTNALQISLNVVEDDVDFIVIDKDETKNGAIKYYHSAGLQIDYKENSTKMHIKSVHNRPPIIPKDAQDNEIK